MAKQRTITLTGRPPVRIDEDQWPVIASAHDDSWSSGGDWAIHDQARRRGELDEYHLVVRQHDDGRALVYAVLDGSDWTDTETHRGGELLDATPDGHHLAAVIRRVGEASGMPDSIIRGCIADLPAEEI